MGKHVHQTFFHAFSALAIFGFAAAAAVGTSDDGPATVTSARPIDPHPLGIGRMLADSAIPSSALPSSGPASKSPARFASLLGPSGAVIAFTTTDCPLARKWAPSLAALQDELAKAGLALIVIDVTPGQSEADARKTHAARGLKGPCLSDPSATLAAAFAAQSTTEAILVDRARTVIYRGAIDDQYALGAALPAPRATYLADAIKALRAGTPPRISATSAPGCVIDAASTKAASTTPATAITAESLPPQVTGQVTWHNTISRIVQTSCLDCHRPGGVGPFALQSIDDVKKHTGTIRREVRRGSMPPWFAEAPAPGAHSPWANDRSLSERDKADLLAWLDGTQPVGNPAEAPVARTFASEWSIGVPDEILTTPEAVKVKATGTMPYVHARIVTEFTEDKWVQAFEVRPTAPAVVHHVLVFVIPPLKPGENAAQRFREAAEESRGFFAAYVPGSTGTIYPDGFAKKLPKGSTLIFQLHYTPNGEATTDRTQLGLRFASAPPRHVMQTAGIVDHRLNIPPGAPNHKEGASLTSPADAFITAFMPHMHTRGKSMLYEITPPGGEKMTVLNVPRYDFNWQLSYRPREPIAIAAGSTIDVTAHFDNSDANPHNPDPTKTVRWGQQTTDEMLIGYIEYYNAVEPVEASDADKAAGDSPQPPSKPAIDATIQGLFRTLDKSSKGVIARSDCPAKWLARFDAMDADNNGQLTEDELRKGLEGGK